MKIKKMDHVNDIVKTRRKTCMTKFICAYYKVVSPVNLCDFTYAFLHKTFNTNKFKVKLHAYVYHICQVVENEGKDFQYNSGVARLLGRRFYFI